MNRFPFTYISRSKGRVFIIGVIKIEEAALAIFFEIDWEKKNLTYPNVSEIQRIWLDLIVNLQFWKNNSRNREKER